MGRGAKEGGLIKDAEALELMEKVDTLVVDKTGTLTEGKPTVQTVVAAKGFDTQQVLAWAASLEKLSEHPLATAIVGRAHADGVTLAARACCIPFWGSCSAPWWPARRWRSVRCQ